jgi:LysR family hydrogen peroxide-inducible transcriptional activator
MNLRDLEYIVATADLGSMSRAAEHCHVSQSTLSIQLKKLEDYLGVMIFERNNKRLTLTTAGNEVLGLARGIIRDSQRLRDVGKSHGDPFAVTFCLGVFPTLAPYLLPQAMPVIGRKFPNLVLRLLEEKSATLVERLMSGELDAALLALPVEGQNLATADLFDDPFLLACHQDHSLAKRKTIAVEDLADEKLLLLEDGHCLRHQALELCYVAQAKENEEFRATSLETLRQMVAAGTGITLMPQIAALPTPNMVYVPFKKPDAPSRKIGLVWRVSSPQKILIEALIKLLKR